MAISKLTRRRFLGAAGAFVLPVSAQASPLFCPPSLTGFSSRFGGSMSGEYDSDFDLSSIALGDEGERRLVLRNAHTGETFDEVYAADGQYVPGALSAFNHFARDHRTGTVHDMDPGLLDLIWNVWKLMETTEPFTALSLYRTRQSNKTVDGASNSQHLYGKACDITHGSRSVDQIHRAAKGLKVGGVGKYSMNRFVHVDTGSVRYWGS